eukprot:COSAG06_NODE_886_length_11771_cov_13.431203_5_plen_71_part_00
MPLRKYVFCRKNKSQVRYSQQKRKSPYKLCRALLVIAPRPDDTMASAVSLISRSLKQFGDVLSLQPRAHR